MAILRQSEVYRRWERELVDEQAKTITATRVSRLAHGLAGDARSLSTEGNARLTTVFAVLRALGLEFSIRLAEATTGEEAEAAE